jgi:predicted enzyme related to lactoylglutathione lyase
MPVQESEERAVVLKAATVIHSVDDLDEAVKFYGDVMGRTLKFRNG